jgi:hypothetical protein
MTQGPQIVVKCPECGERRIAPEEVTVRGCLDDGSWSYRFSCPICFLPTIGASTMTALMSAVDAGAAFEAWELPTDLDARPAGPRFTFVDVLELHTLLLEPDWFDELSRCHLDAD